MRELNEQELQSVSGGFNLEFLIFDSNGDFTPFGKVFGTVAAAIGLVGFYAISSIGFILPALYNVGKKG